MDDTLSRRGFAQCSLTTIVTTSLLQALFEHDAFADSIKPITERWLRDFTALAGDVKGQAIKPTVWQDRVEALFGKVELDEMLRLIDFEQLAKKVHFPKKGEGAAPIRFPPIEGLTPRLGFGRTLFAAKKGRSIAPHGHNNMATAFYVLQGEFHGRHYQRVEDSPTHLLIRPTIDQAFGPTSCSTVSDFKDNVHWFTATSETAFLFNIHIMDVNPTDNRESNRVYVDPKGEKIDGGLIRAPLITSKQAYERYG